MSFYSSGPSQVMDEASCTILSQYTPRTVPNVPGTAQSQDILTDRYSYDEVFSLMLQRVHEVGSKLEDLGRKYSEFNDSSKIYRLRNLSRSNDEEYSDILENKGYFIEKLTAAVNVSEVNDARKYRISCYQELSSLLSNQNNEGEIEVHQDKEKLKSLESESHQLSSEISTFSSIVQKGNHPNESQESSQAAILFQEAKSDLDILLKSFFSDDKDKKEFVSAISMLIAAYENNLDSKEDQFVEIPFSTSKNKGIDSLRRGGVVIRHPLHHTKYRFSVED